MCKTLYLMRHGQTRFNQQGRIQGACDSPLTDLGIEQARAAYHYFEKNGIVFDEVYSSTQERACDTCELVSGRSDYVRLKGIKEWDFGAFEGQQEYLNPPLQGDLGYNDYFVTFGGESYEEVRQRVSTTITNILEKSDKKSFLMVSHGAAIAQFYRHVLTNYPNIRTPNCGIYQFSYDQGTFDLLAIIDPVTDQYLYQKTEKQ